MDALILIAPMTVVGLGLRWIEYRIHRNAERFFGLEAGSRKLDAGSRQQEIVNREPSIDNFKP